MLANNTITPADAWFAARGWSPFPFQYEVWRAYRAGRSGLVHAATGTGKTQAAWWGPVLEYLEEREKEGGGAGGQGGRGVEHQKPPSAPEVSSSGRASPMASSTGTSGS